MSRVEPYECFPVPDDYMSWEASVVTLTDDAILLVFSSRDTAILLGMISRDLCRTWEGPFPLRTDEGQKIEGCPGRVKPTAGAGHMSLAARQAQLTRIR